MIITSLHSSRPRLPNLHGPVFGGCNHPLSFTVEGDTCDVVCVSLESEDWVRVCGFDIVELDVVVARCGEETLIGGDAEAVYLGVGVLDCAGADAGEGLPESRRDCQKRFFATAMRRTACACAEMSFLGVQESGELT